MKFAHLGDCHLGGWRQPELKDLNFQCFQKAIDTSIAESVDFVLVAGDLFDSAYPPIDVLKSTFKEFRRLKEKNIPVFIIAGSHDYSASGKTFLDVLEKAGFCKNISIFEEKDEKIMLLPTVFKNVALYGYPGKKSGLEVDEIERIKIQDAPGMFKILMLHTTIRDAIKNLPIKAVDERKLPKVDYLALAHLHIRYQKENRVYSGPIFPNNISEIEDLGAGSFYIYDNGNVRRIDLKVKDVIVLDVKLSNAIEATEQIKKKILEANLKDKITVLKISGVLEQGKTSDIEFAKLEKLAQERGAYVFLRSTSKLHISNPEVELDLRESIDFESEIIKKFQENNESKFNSLIPQMIKSLQIEKLEDERLAVFEDRLISECKKIIQ